jgi:hypothetical protein
VGIRQTKEGEIEYCTVQVSGERGGEVSPQSRQSAKLFSSRRNWDSPNPSLAGDCASPPFGSGGRGTLAGERGAGESQFRRGDIHCGTLYIYVGQSQADEPSEGWPLIYR